MGWWLAVIFMLIVLGAGTYFWLWPLLVVGFAWVAAINFAAVFAVLAVGSIWFWLLLLLESGLLCFYFLDDSDDDDTVGFGATVSIVVTIALMSVFGNFLSYLWSHSYWIIAYIVGYLLAGALYTVLRVHDFASEASDALEELVHQYLKEKKISHEEMMASPDKLSAMKVFVRQIARYKSPVKRLREEDGKVWIRDHKARVMTWLMYWPWSLLWYLTNDLFRRLYAQIYSLIAGSLQRVADYATRGTNKYYQPDPPPSTPPTSEEDGREHSYGARDPRELP